MNKGNVSRHILKFYLVIGYVIIKYNVVMQICQSQIEFYSLGFFSASSLLYKFDKMSDFMVIATRVKSEQSTVISKDCKVLEVSTDEKFIDINIEKAEYDSEHIFLRANCKGNPNYIDGKIEVEGKLCISE